MTDTLSPSDLTRRAGQDAARRAAQDAARAQATQTQTQTPTPTTEQPAGVDAANKTRDVVAAAAVDNERGGVAAAQLTTTATRATPALPVVTTPPVTSATLQQFNQQASTSTEPAAVLERGQQAAELAARATRQVAAAVERGARGEVRALQRDELDFRQREATRLEAAAATSTDPAQQLQLQRTAEALRFNLPTDDGQRAIVEGLAAGTPPASQLGQAEARLAQSVLKDFPPANASLDTMSGFHGANARSEALKAVNERVATVDATYQANGWATDLPIRAGTPGADQALIANAVDVGRANNPNGIPAARDFKALSPQATADTLKAVDNFRRDNASLFGDPPPTDPQALQTRTAVNQLDGAVRRHADIQRVQQQIDGVSTAFSTLRDSQGVIGNAADGLKNMFNTEEGSRSVSTAVDGLVARRASVDALYEHSGDDASFRKAFADTTQNVASSITGVGERVARYGSSQRAWVDGITSAAAATAAIAAAPLTGGASIAGLTLGAAVGATVKVATNGLEAVTGAGTYPGNVVSDALTGALSGFTGPIAGRVGTALAARFGGGLLGSAAGFGISGGADGFVNGTGSSLFDGESLSKALQHGVNGAAFGAVLAGGGASLGNFFSRLEVSPNTLGSNLGNVRLRPDKLHPEVQLPLKNMETLNGTSPSLGGTYRPDLLSHLPENITAGPARVVDERFAGGIRRQQYEVVDSAGNRIGFDNKEGKHMLSAFAADSADDVARKLRAANAGKDTGSQFTSAFSTTSGQQQLINEAMAQADLRLPLSNVVFRSANTIGAAIDDTGRIAPTSSFRMYGSPGQYHLVPVPDVN